MTNDAARPPYPGLRAFRREETDLFFGREDCINTMVDRLAAARFLAVLGSSGTGKSSLVRTGLLDALELGLMSKAGPRWRIVDFRPSGAPLKHLATRLLETEDPEGKAEHPEKDVDLLRAYLARGPRSIIEWCRAGHLPKDTSLLLLVDQFEELFRYQNYAGREEAEAFVAMLLESAQTKEFPIYIAITMRSEYLGACALIEGLSDVINAGMFLTPRMTRDQCREAIVGPAQVCGIDIEPALVNRLLNDLANFAPWDDSDNQDQLDRIMRRADQLPLLQYTLNRMWLRARERSADERIKLTLGDYEAIGGLSGALNAHADKIFDELGESRRPIVEWVFRALTAGTTVADAVRRPTRFDDLVAACGGDAAATRDVVDAFRAPGVNFLVPELDPKHPQLPPDAYIDISHESLIRQWKKLSEWLDQEARAAQQWRRLIDRFGTGELLRGRELANLIAWRAETRPNAAWAKRYGGDYEPVIGFLDQSQRAEQKQRNTRLMVRAAAVLLVVCTAGALAYLEINAGQERVRRELAEAQNKLDAANYQLMAAQEAETRARAERNYSALTTFTETLIFNITQRTKDAEINTAVVVATETLNAVRKLAEENPGDNDLKRALSVSLNIFGDVKVRADDTGAAGQAFDESLAIARGLVQIDPTKSLWQDDLALALVRVANIKAKKIPAQTPANRAEVAAQFDSIRKFYEEAVGIDRKLVAASPNTERVLNNCQVHLGQFGDFLIRIPDLKAAYDEFVERLDIRRKLLALDPTNTQRQRDVSAGLDKVGDVLRRLGDMAGAQKVFDEELEMDRQLAARLPDDAKSQQDLAWSLINIGDVKSRANNLAEARKLYEQATELRRRVVTRDPENASNLKELSAVLDKVGNMARQLNDTAAAGRAFDEELAIDRKLATRDPNNTQWQRDLSWTLARVGDLQRQLEDFTGALKTYDESLEVERRLAARDPTSAERQQAVAAVWEKIGDVKQRQKDFAGARIAYEEALDLRRKVSALDPENVQWRKDTSTALDRVGYILLVTEDLPGARKYFEDEAAIDRKLAEEDPGNMAAQRDLVWSLNRVGDLLQKTGDRPGARKYFEEVVALDAKVAAGEPNNVERHRKQTEDLTKLTGLLLDMGDIVAVRSSYEQLFKAEARWADVVRRELAAGTTDKHSDLVQALGIAGWHALLGNQPLEAARLSEEALKLDSSQTWINVNLGHAYLFLGRVDDAKKIYAATKDVPRGTEGNRKFADDIKDDFNLFRKLQISLSDMNRIESDLGI